MDSIAGRIKETARHFAVYGAGAIGAQVANVVLLPLFTRRLSADEYGALALLTITGTAALILFGCGLSTALFRTYFQRQGERERSQVLTTALVLALSAGALLALAGTATAPVLSRVLFGSARHAGLVRLTMYTNGAALVNGLVLSAYRARQRSLQYSLLNTATIVLRLLTVAALVAGFGMALDGAVLGYLISAVLGVVLVLGAVYRDLGRGFLPGAAREMLSFGAPLVVSGLALLAVTMFGQLAINRYGTLEQVGVFTLAGQLGSIANLLLVAPFTLVWPTMVFAVHRQHYAADYYQRIFTYFAAAAAALFAAISGTAADVLRIVAAPGYWPAAAIVPWMAAGNLLFGMATPAAVGILLLGETKYDALTVVIGASVSLALNIALVGRFGVTGGAAAFLAGNAVMFGLYVAFSQRLYPVRFEWARLGKIVAAMSVTCAVMLWVRVPGPYASLLVRLSLMLIYPALLVLMRFFRPGELGWARRQIARVRRDDRVR